MNHLKNIGQWKSGLSLFTVDRKVRLREDTALAQLKTRHKNKIMAIFRAMTKEETGAF